MKIMKNNWILRLQVRFRKFRRSIRNRIQPPDVLNPKQQKMVGLFKIALKDENNVLYLNNKKSTSSEKMYIVSKEYVLNREIKTYIMFEQSIDGSGYIVAVNHHYKYDETIPSRTSSQLIKLFEEAVYKERERMEQEIMNNITESLEIVLDNFKEKMLESIKERQEKKPN